MWGPRGIYMGLWPIMGSGSPLKFHRGICVGLTPGIYMGPTWASPWWPTVAHPNLTCYQAGPQDYSLISDLSFFKKLIFALT